MIGKTVTFCLLFLFFLQNGRLGAQNDCCLIPQVERLIRQEGTLSVGRIKTISFPDEWRGAGTAFVNDLRELVHLTVRRTTSVASIRVKKVQVQEPERYTLQVTERGIVIEAGDQAGMNRAFATLLQLLVTHPEAGIPRLIIHDKPRFAYRGVMIDCSRHFWTIDQLKKFIRQLAFFKLNVLHLHLTDNQGWRLQLDGYPDLARKGSHYRTHEALSGRYYRKEELRELIDYATMYGVAIIPEVDLPGHCQALLAALPELSCNGGTFEVYPEEAEGPKMRPGENMLCIGNPETYRFVETLVSELTELFPSPLIHLGGDEVSTHIWEQCPKCQHLYQEQQMTSRHQLQDYFTKRVSEIVRSRGKKMIGWDEINDRNAAHTDDVIMVWQRDGEEQQIKALRRGLSVILSPKDPCYLDFGYSRNSTRRLYEWEPVSLACTDAEARLLKGGQVNLWTEFITTADEVERMLYPRTAALAETLWSALKQKDWNGFQERMNCFTPIWERLDIHYFKEENLSCRGFVPQQEVLPRLVQPARMETNMDGIRYYLPAYVFDGDTETFFATPYSLEKGSYFTLVLERSQPVRQIQVLFDVSKEHPDRVELSVSEDGQTFTAVPATLREGVLEITLDSPVALKACKIELTAPLMARLSIKEFVFH